MTPIKSEILSKARSLNDDKIERALALLDKYAHQKYDAQGLLMLGVISVIEARGIRIGIDSVEELWNASERGDRK